MTHLSLSPPPAAQRTSITVGVYDVQYSSSTPVSTVLYSYSQGEKESAMLSYSVEPARRPFFYASIPFYPRRRPQQN